MTSRKPCDQWPDQRTPLYDPDKINALKEKS